MNELNFIDILNYIRNNEILYNNFIEESNPDINVIDEIIKIQPSGKVIIISEAWCKDCRRDVPKLGKISSKLPDWDFSIADGGIKEVRKHFKISKIPTTLIFGSNDSELGKIIEKARFNSLENDILQIIKGKYD